MSATETVSPPPPRGALTTADAAFYLGYPRRVTDDGAIEQDGVGTLNNLRSSGDGPKFAKLGASVRYRIIDLDQYLADHVVGGAE